MKAGWVAMRPVTAVALLCLAISLWTERPEGPTARWRRLAGSLAVAAALLGIVALLEYLLHTNLLIDRLLFPKRIGTGGFPSPGRMAALTGASLVLLGVARLAAGRPSRAARRAAESLTVVVGLIAALVLITYLFGVAPGGRGTYVPVAANAALAFVALSVALVARNPDFALVRVLTSEPPGGTLARALPVLLGAVLLLGWFEVRAERAGAFSYEFGDAAQVVSIALLLGTIVLWGALRLNRVERRRRKAESGLRENEDRLRQSEAEFRRLVEHAPVGIYRSSAAGRFLTVNPALTGMLGYASVEEMLRLDIARDLYVERDVRDDLTRLTERHDVATREVEWKRKDGRRITVRLSVRAIRGESGDIEFYEGLAEDVTQQHVLEAQFRQAQRLEAVGRLAGGVAHDFNN
ncbi:MAG: hypothetical protein B7X11_04255, partial [Acidobacteria bacterium 37-65-4]